MLVYRFAALFALFMAAAFGQEWYAGVTAGYGYSPSLTATNSSGSANTGFDNGYVAGAFFGGDTYSYWGGEVHYLYRQSDLKLSSGGTSAHLAGNTNILNADILWHLRPRESPLRPFLLFGAGMKFLDGTGAPSASQPLGNFAALTNTRETIPVADVGGGVKINFHTRWQFRAEVHDYIGPAPHKVIAAAPGASLSSWLNDIIGTASIVYRW